MNKSHTQGLFSKTPDHLEIHTQLFNSLNTEGSMGRVSSVLPWRPCQQGGGGWTLWGVGHPVGFHWRWIGSMWPRGKPAWSCNGRRCEMAMETPQIKISWLFKCKTQHKWQSFYSLSRYGWPRAFPKQNPVKHRAGDWDWDWDWDWEEAPRDGFARVAGNG